MLNTDAQQRRSLLKLISLGGITAGALGCSPSASHFIPASDGDAVARGSKPILSPDDLASTSSNTKSESTYEIGLGDSSIESHVQWPDFRLTNQHNQSVDFYGDLVSQNRIVLNFFYTRCSGNCPVTMGRMIKLAKNLQGVDCENVQFISVSLDTERETAEDLLNYANNILPKEVNWSLLCGDPGNVDRLRRYLGFYEIDEATDAIPRSHASMVLFGNDATHRWISLPAISSYRQWRSVLSRVAS